MELSLRATSGLVCYIYLYIFFLFVHNSILEKGGRTVRSPRKNVRVDNRADKRLADMHDDKRAALAELSAPPNGLFLLSSDHFCLTWHKSKALANKARTASPLFSWLPRRCSLCVWNILKSKSE